MEATQVAIDNLNTALVAIGKAMVALDNTPAIEMRHQREMLANSWNDIKAVQLAVQDATE